MTSTYIKNIAFNRKLIASLLTVVLSALAVWTFSPRSAAVTNGGVMNTIGTPLTENFDSLASTSTNIPWVDNSTIPGWYASRSTYNTGTGSANTGAMMSYGVAGTNPLTERAIGSVASGGTGTISQGVRLVNNTGITITSLDISYVGEQWRNGGNTTAQTLQFQYQVANAGVITNITSGTWTAFTSLNFTSIVNTATAAALDGNNPLNRTAKAATLTVNVAPGQEIWLRWVDPDDPGNDHGYGIDELSITPQGVAGDAAPSVSANTPLNNAINVSASSNLSITFSEAVNTTGNWFQIACGTSGTRTPGDTLVSGGPTIFTIDPNTDFAPSEQCTVTVFAANVSDQDSDDPPDNMTSNASFSFTIANPPVDAGAVAISQLYGGGGNAGAVLRNDFIEIINRTGAPINLNGWSVQYASATGSGWQVTPLTGSIGAGQYYLIQEASGGANGALLPTADATGTINMSATAGKVALVNGTTALTDACPSDPSIIDFVGFGTTANCFEGSGPTPPPSASNSVFRNNNGCEDTNDNADDFTASSPNPRNTASPTTNCAVLSGTGSASPPSVQPGSSSLLTVNVTPGSNPTSTGITVVADLSAIGGSASQSFTGNGNSFSFLATVAMATTAGPKVFPVTISDAQSRTANTTINLTVLQPPPAADHVVISQIYGGGGNASATYSSDFVELYNPGSSPFDLTGWSLQYASFNGSGWGSNKQPLGGIIGPGEYYLIKLATGATGAALPPANVEGIINLSGSTGKVALVSSFQPLSGTCPLSDPNLVDFVGYGSNASTSNFCYEGTAPAPAPPSGNNTQSIFRNGGGATDTNNNGTDFATGAVNPRRTAPIVELGPNVLTTDPASNGFNIPKDGNITITFTEPVDVVGAWYNILCTDSLTHNDGTVAVLNGNRTFVIIPNLNFPFGGQCTVTVDKDQVHDQDLDDSGPNTDGLPFDYIWTFDVVSAGAPAPYPPSVHLTMGNPSNAVANVLQFNNYLMEKPSFSLSYNRDKGTPNWVSWHLTDEWFGSLARFDTFRGDPAVPETWYRVLGTDYSSSGFDRGHMTPNADRDHENRIPINQETYLMTNMIPQAPDNNQGPWANMENDLRTLLNGSANELYIVSGPLGVGGSGANGGVTNTIANGQVTVPAFTWKVVLMLPKGENDISRVTAATRTIAVLMPNVQGIRFDPWQNYLTTVDNIESLTGYDFFANLPDEIENAVEAGTNGVNPPGTTGQSVATAEDNPVNITLSAASPGGTLTYTVVTPPANGQLSGSGANLTYNPNPDYFGPDSFTFKVNDGSQDSNTSTVSITVTEVNDAPAANDDPAATDEDTQLNINAADLTTNDSTGPANESLQNLTVTTVIATANTHGTVALNSGTIAYQPDADYNGPASFTYQVCDDGTTNGAPDSQCATGTVNLTVNPINDMPTANSQAVSTGGNTPVAITLTGNDLETVPANLTFVITVNPTNGSLSGTGANRTYTPAPNYTGPDSFKFTVTDTGDGSSAPLTSAEATVTITVNDTINPTVTAPPDLNLGTGPGATNCSLFISDATLGTATASDNSGVVTVVRTGVPAGNIFPVGTTIITYTATDGAGNTAQDTQTIVVSDSTAPTLTMIGNTITLSPPNHKYHTISVADLVASASDSCDASVNLNKVVISKVTSDEAENGNGSGNTNDDIVIGANCKTVQLRAEREGGGDGRVYTITFRVTDQAGNSTTKTGKVVVPKNGNGGAVDSGVKYTVNGTCP